MSDRLDDLARSHGIQTRYTSEHDEPTDISDEAKRALLKVLNVDPQTGETGDFASKQHEAARRCVLPKGVRDRRAWGLTCQLYGLRSSRNLGIGDFEDLAQLTETAAEAGAAFVGVNPLHALFLADLSRISPYSPSTRRFLNPLYIAVDQLRGGKRAIRDLREEDAGAFVRLDGDLVEYGAAASLKGRLLRRLFDQRDGETEDGLEAFRKKNHDSLRSFALFEAISAHEVRAGGHAGWHGWPGDLQHRQGEAVARFEGEHENDVRFHEWLQFIADQQLAHAHARAKAAGMRIGLYLDFAVGVAPDGADTWADPDLTVRDARVGSPPDLHNSEGQDWRLAPLSPGVLAARKYKPLADAYAASMRHAGAMRIDHAMGLARLWWIPASGTAAGGGYVCYPLGAMIDTVAEASEVNGCIVIGEDLGTVPEGFCPAMEAANILSYRVLYFERGKTGQFVPPAQYPELALACISTHDLATLSGWWTASDITLRAETGRQTEAATERELQDRERDRTALLAALDREGLLPSEYADILSRERPMPVVLAEDLAAAIHRFGARARSLMFAVQLEDAVLSPRQPNLPGTTDEYPNWRIRSDVTVENLAADPRFQTIARAVREERPECS
ncbi:MAG: 4-alpha-glucanotransferase [Betaproteobacteria bacterium]|nr:4-alpha-glucanotransferase [Betaproteobacteria bacterium]